MYILFYKTFSVKTTGIQIKPRVTNETTGIHYICSIGGAFHTPTHYYTNTVNVQTVPSQIPAAKAMSVAVQTSPPKQIALEVKFIPTLFGPTCTSP